jgi:hypothetical protein
MSFDPGAFAFGFIAEGIRRLRQRRRAKRAAKNLVKDEVTVMDKGLAVQLVLAALRHAMTAAAPLGIAVSDNGLVEIATVLVTLGGLVWSAARKIKAA